MDRQVAVKAVMRNAAGKYLIMQENGRWQGVGGRLEGDETLEQGVRRETLEETGIADMRIGPVIHVDEWFAKPEGERKHIIALFYLCDVTEADVILSSEHQASAWVSPTELASYGDTLEPEIRQAIQLAAGQAAA